MNNSDSQMICSFFIEGVPQTAGSKRSFVPLDKRRITPEFPNGTPYTDQYGRVIVNTVDDNPKSRAWKQVVGYSAKMARTTNEPVDFPVEVHFVFVLPRPKSHYGTGRNGGMLKTSAPLFHTIRPDALKCARSIEDSLTGIVWLDDAQIVHEVLDKIYGDRPGVLVRVARASPEIGLYRSITEPISELAQTGN